MNIKQEKSFNDIADIYDETRYLPEKINQKFYEKLVKNGINFEKSSILDCGIGTGRTIAPLLKYNIELIGIDNSNIMIKKLREKFKDKIEFEKVRLTIGDITCLPFKNNSFDLVISIQVLHLLKDFKQAINEVRRVLKPKGYFVIAMATSSALASNVTKKYFKLSLKYNIIKNLKKKFMDLLYLLNDIRYINYLINIVLSRHDYEIYLKRNTSKLMRDKIVWTENINPYEVYERLNKRMHTNLWNIPNIQHEKIMNDLKILMNKEKKPWSNEEKITRNFNFIITQF